MVKKKILVVDNEQDMVKALKVRLKANGYHVVLASDSVQAFMIANQEIEAARRRSQIMLAELRETNRQLQSHADQVEELAGLRERNRLARNLHDTVSQLLFSVVLTSRSAQILLDRDRPQVRRELEVLQELTATALNKLRSLISQLRP